MERFLNAVDDWRHDPELVFGALGMLTASVLLSLFLAGLLPLDPINWGFFSLLFFLLALYRPNWSFLALVATLPFEIITVSPESLGFSIRPYQWLFFLIALALGIRILSSRTRWPIFAWSWIDILLALVPIGAILSGALSGGEGVRLAVIVASFYVLYLLGRVFLQTPGDIRIAGTTLFASGIVTLVYGIAQNIAFEQGRILHAVMPGRPNATFAEPDWLGLFAAALLVFALSRLDGTLRRYAEDPRSSFFRIAVAVFVLLPIVIVLVLTVSRSAWLAAIVALAVWAALSLFVGGKESLRHVLQAVQCLVIAFVIALLIIVDVPLTRFDLFNRAESTATGLQLITVACETPTELPEKIASIEELPAFGCRHINLEEREALRSAGLSIQTTRRPDPNVEIRSEIYAKTWNEIRAHPVFGIGWGNIGPILGTDEHGSSYNASNVWLEIILGAGLIGLIGLAGMIGNVLYRGGAILCRPESRPGAKGLPLLFSLLAAFLVFNLFNAGLLIGLVWLGFAALPAVLSFSQSKSV